MNNWYIYFGTEILGSALLIILGNGVIANVVLRGTKGHKNSNFLMIALGWGFALGIGVFVATALGGKGHLNPAVTLAFVVNHWTTNVGAWGLLPLFWVGQILGFLIGQIIVDLVYSQQILSYFRRTKKDFKTEANRSVLSMHATVPQTRVVWSNFLMEFIGTVVLVLTILSVGKFNIPTDQNFLVPIFIMVALMAIGCSLSGTTGFAVNPFRDLIPRTVYQVLICLPCSDHREDADWCYSWIPVVAPLVAGAIVGACFL